jgi:serpin B
MAGTLRTRDLPREALERGNAALRTGLVSADPRVTLTVANGLWTQPGITIHPAYATTLRTAYEAELGALGPDAAARINGWIAQRTNNKVTRMIDQIGPDTLMLLANAVYFKGTWTYKFNPATPGDFTTRDGRRVQTPMMGQDGRFAHFQEGDVEGIRLPYGDGRISMVLLLPSADSSLDALRSGLTQERWGQWMAGLGEPETGTIVMPKFKAGFDTQLNGVLTRMGMGVAFGPAADFSGISPTPQHISEVRHRAIVEVDENGTEAAGVTIVTTRGLGGPFRMTVDRPFLFAIVDENNLPLFLGQVTDPTRS